MQRAAGSHKRFQNRKQVHLGHTFRHQAQNKALWRPSFPKSHPMNFLQGKRERQFLCHALQNLKTPALYRELLLSGISASWESYPQIGFWNWAPWKASTRGSGNRCGSQNRRSCFHIWCSSWVPPILLSWSFLPSIWTCWDQWGIKKQKCPSHSRSTLWLDLELQSLYSAKLVLAQNHNTVVDKNDHRNHQIYWWW